MELLLVWIVSFAIAALIVSPFFWLRFLKEKGMGKYLIVSFCLTTLILIIVTFIFKWSYKLINSYTYLDYFDSISVSLIFILVLLATISPFIFTKIIKHKFTTKSFFFSLVLSVIIFAAIFLFWAFVLLPWAFSQLHNYI